MNPLQMFVVYIKQLFKRLIGPPKIPKLTMPPPPHYGQAPITPQPKAGLGIDDITEILRLRRAGWSQQKLANKYGLHRSTIGRIVNDPKYVKWAKPYEDKAP